MTTTDLTGSVSVHPDATVVSPYEVAVSGGGGAVELREKRQLVSMSRAAEHRALSGDEASLVLVAIQDARFWTGRTAGIYARIAALGTTVVVFGVGLPTDLTGPQRQRIGTVGIGGDDLLADEWLVLFCSPRQRWGFVARDADAGLPGARSGPRVATGDDEHRLDDDRLFRWARLSDPIGLERAAAVLLTRVPVLARSVPWLCR